MNDAIHGWLDVTTISHLSLLWHICVILVWHLCHIGLTSVSYWSDICAILVWHLCHTGLTAMSNLCDAYLTSIRYQFESYFTCLPTPIQHVYLTPVWHLSDICLTSIWHQVSPLHCPHWLFLPDFPTRNRRQIRVRCVRWSVYSIRWGCTVLQCRLLINQ